MFSLIPGSRVIYESIEKSSREIDEAASKDISELRMEIEKQDLIIKFDLQRARIAQEMAIANRIANAEIVEIEEFFDISGKGQIGLGTDEVGLNFGANGNGQKITKRIYKFSGYREISSLSND